MTEQRGPGGAAHPTSHAAGSSPPPPRWWSTGPTSGDHALQSYHVAVVELAQGEGLGQEAEPLRVGAALPQRVHSHGELLAARELQAATAQLPKPPWGRIAPQTPPGGRCLGQPGQGEQRLAHRPFLAWDSGLLSSILVN